MRIAACKCGRSASRCFPTPPAAGARETVRFLPPLNVKAGEIEQALGIFEGALAEVFSTPLSGSGSTFGQDLSDPTMAAT